MTQRLLPPPFIAEPPTRDSFFEEDGSISSSWINWLNSVTRVMGYSIVHDYLIDAGTGVRKEEVPLLMATGLTTTRRNELENARNGTILYNLTTNRMNFRENNTWVTFTAVPA